MNISNSIKRAVFWLVCALAALLVVACTGGGAAQQAGSNAQADASSRRETQVYDAGTTPAPSESKPEPAPTEPAETRIHLLMVGDVLAHQRVWESGYKEDGSRNYDHLFAHTKERIEAADLALVDQETPLGGDELGISGYPVFNSPQEIGDAEAAAGFDVIIAATNHVVDKGQVGVHNTLEFWRAKHPEITVLGMYETQEDFDHIYIYEKDGFTVAVLNYTYGTNGIPLPENNPYATILLDEHRDKVLADVRAAREAADVVVVCPHWGEEYMTEPVEYQRTWAQTFADMGVDVIFGNHPHVIEPVELVRGEDGNECLVFWSAGNFTSSQSGTDKIVGGMSEVELVKTGESVKLESWSFTPIINHRDYGTAHSTYLLRDYTEELAAANHGQPGSLATIADFCSSVLGEAYNREKCVLEGGEVSIAALSNADLASAA